MPIFAPVDKPPPPAAAAAEAGVVDEDAEVADELVDADDAEVVRAPVRRSDS